MLKYGFLITLAVIGVLGFEEDYGTSFVTGGRLAVGGEFASDCSIDTPFQLHCQGVLINNRHLLTAASCVINGTDNTLINPVWLRVTCGDNNLFVATPGREVRTVSHIYPHDAFIPTTNNNDLAVLRLTTEITFPHNTAEEVLFNTRIVPDATTCQFSGWGASNNASNLMTPDKMVLTFPIVNRNTCNGPTMAHPGRALETMICAGITAGTGTPPVVPQAVCRGNVGGCLYCNGECVGILSFGLSCGAANHPGIYTQTRLYQAWMNQQVARTDVVQPGTVFPRP